MHWKGLHSSKQINVLENKKKKLKKGVTSWAFVTNKIDLKYKDNY